MPEKQPFGGSGGGRSSSSGGIGQGKQDIKQFRDNLEGKELTHYNANDVLQQYLSKRANIETVVGERYQKKDQKKNDMEEMLGEEEYRDEGFVRELTFEKSRDALDTTEKILQWRELQIQVQDVLLKKQNELITRMKGQDMSRQVLEEMREVFDQKFESDKEKLNVIQETLNERLDNAKDNINERIDEVERRERQQLQYTAKQINQLHEVLDKIEDKIEIEIEREGVPDDLTQQIEERTEESVPDKAKTEETKEKERQEEIEAEIEQQEEEDEEEEVEMPRNWDADAEADPRPVENPAIGFTQEIDVRDTSEMDWKVLRALDEGRTTKSGIRDHADTNLMAMPMQQINKMVRKGYMNPEKLPESIEDEVTAEIPEDPEFEEEDEE